MPSGIERIAKERRRQIDVEDWTSGHDDEHDGAEMAVAAICYALEGCRTRFSRRRIDGMSDKLWPWDPCWWKPTDDPIRNLEKAGALIAAEIDRLLREEPSE